MKDRVPAEHGGAGVEVARAGLPSAFGWPDALDLLARAGAGSVFLYAGVVKAMDRQAMVLAVHGYRLAPKALEKPIATGLPWLEIALGAGVAPALISVNGSVKERCGTFTLSGGPDDV